MANLDSTVDFMPATIPEQIDEMSSLEISYRTLHPKLDITNIQTNTLITVPFSSYINKYRILLSEIITEHELTLEEKERWWFSPKIASQDIYGTTEFWDVLLPLNECTSITQFKPEVLKYYDEEYFKEYLTEIMILEGVNLMY
jgi:hypothetical protein